MGDPRLSTHAISGAEDTVSRPRKNTLSKRSSLLLADGFRIDSGEFPRIKTVQPPIMPTKVGLIVWRMCCNMAKSVFMRCPQKQVWQQRANRLSNSSTFSKILVCIFQWKKHAEKELTWVPVHKYDPGPKLPEGKGDPGHKPPNAWVSEATADVDAEANAETNAKAEKANANANADANAEVNESSVSDIDNRCEYFVDPGNDLEDGNEIGWWILSEAKGYCRVRISDCVAAMMHCAPLGGPPEDIENYLREYKAAFRIKWSAIRMYSAEARMNMALCRRRLQQHFRDVDTCARRFQLEARMLTNELQKKRTDGIQLHSYASMLPLRERLFMVQMRQSEMATQASLASSSLSTFRQLGKLHSSLLGVRFVLDAPAPVPVVESTSPEEERTVFEERKHRRKEERAAKEAEQKKERSRRRRAGRAGQVRTGRRAADAAAALAALENGEESSETEGSEDVAEGERQENNYQCPADLKERLESSLHFDDQDGHAQRLQDLKDWHDDISLFVAGSSNRERYFQLLQLMDQGNEKLQLLSAVAQRSEENIERFRDAVEEALLEETITWAKNTASGDKMPNYILERVARERFVPRVTVAQRDMKKAVLAKLQAKVNGQSEQSTEEQKLLQMLNGLRQAEAMHLTKQAFNRRKSDSSRRQLMSKPERNKAAQMTAALMPQKLSACRQTAVNIRDEVKLLWPPGSSAEGDQMLTTAQAYIDSVQELRGMVDKPTEDMPDPDMQVLDQKTNSVIQQGQQLCQDMDNLAMTAEVGELPQNIIEAARKQQSWMTTHQQSDANMHKRQAVAKARFRAQQKKAEQVLTQLQQQTTLMKEKSQSQKQTCDALRRLVTEALAKEMRSEEQRKMQTEPQPDDNKSLAVGSSAMASATSVNAGFVDEANSWQAEAQEHFHQIKTQVQESKRALNDQKKHRDSLRDQIARIEAEIVKEQHPGGRRGLMDVMRERDGRKGNGTGRGKRAARGRRHVLAFENKPKQVAQSAGPQSAGPQSAGPQSACLHSASSGIAAPEANPEVVSNKQIFAWAAPGQMMPHGLQLPKSIRDKLKLRAPPPVKLGQRATPTPQANATLPHGLEMPQGLCLPSGTQVLQLPFGYNFSGVNPQKSQQQQQQQDQQQSQQHDEGDGVAAGAQLTSREGFALQADGTWRPCSDEVTRAVAHAAPWIFGDGDITALRQLSALSGSPDSKENPLWVQLFPHDSAEAAKQKYDFCREHQVDYKHLHMHKRMRRLKFKLMRAVKQQKRTLQLKMRVLMTFFNTDDQKTMEAELLQTVDPELKMTAFHQAELGRLTERYQTLGKLLEFWRRRMGHFDDEVEARCSLVQDEVGTMVEKVSRLARALNGNERIRRRLIEVEEGSSFSTSAVISKQSATSTSATWSQVVVGVGDESSGQTTLKQLLRRAKRGGFSGSNLQGPQTKEHRAASFIHQMMMSLAKVKKPLAGLASPTLSDALANWDNNRSRTMFKNFANMIREMPHEESILVTEYLVSLEQQRMVDVAKLTNSRTRGAAFQACQDTVAVLRGELQVCDLEANLEIPQVMDELEAPRRSLAEEARATDARSCPSTLGSVTDFDSSSSASTGSCLDSDFNCLEDGSEHGDCRRHEQRKPPTLPTINIQPPLSLARQVDSTYNKQPRRSVPVAVNGEFDDELAEWEQREEAPRYISVTAQDVSVSVSKAPAHDSTEKVAGEEERMLDDACASSAPELVVTAKIQLGMGGTRTFDILERKLKSSMALISGSLQARLSQLQERYNSETPSIQATAPFGFIRDLHVGPRELSPAPGAVTVRFSISGKECSRMLQQEREFKAFVDEVSETVASKTSGMILRSTNSNPGENRTFPTLPRASRRFSTFASFMKQETNSQRRESRCYSTRVARSFEDFFKSIEKTQTRRDTVFKNACFKFSQIQFKQAQRLQQKEREKERKTERHKSAGNLLSEPSWSPGSRLSTGNQNRFGMLPERARSAPPPDQRRLIRQSHALAAAAASSLIKAEYNRRYRNSEGVKLTNAQVKEWDAMRNAVRDVKQESQSEKQRQMAAILVNVDRTAHRHASGSCSPQSAHSIASPFFSGANERTSVELHETWFPPQARTAADEDRRFGAALSALAELNRELIEQKKSPYLSRVQQAAVQRAATWRLDDILMRDHAPSISKPRRPRHSVTNESSSRQPLPRVALGVRRKAGRHAGSHQFSMVPKSAASLQSVPCHTAQQVPRRRNLHVSPEDTTEATAAGSGAEADDEADDTGDAAFSDGTFSRHHAGKAMRPSSPLHELSVASTADTGLKKSSVTSQGSHWARNRRCHRRGLMVSSELRQLVVSAEKRLRPQLRNSGTTLEQAIGMPLTVILQSGLMLMTDQEHPDMLFGMTPDDFYETMRRMTFALEKRCFMAPEAPKRMRPWPQELAHKEKQKKAAIAVRGVASSLPCVLGKAQVNVPNSAWGSGTEVEIIQPEAPPAASASPEEPNVLAAATSQTAAAAVAAARAARADTAARTDAAGSGARARIASEIADSSVHHESKLLLPGLPQRLQRQDAKEPLPQLVANQLSTAFQQHERLWHSSRRETSKHKKLGQVRGSLGLPAAVPVRELSKHEGGGDDGDNSDMINKNADRDNGVTKQMPHGKFVGSRGESHLCPAADFSAPLSSSRKQLPQGWAVLNMPRESQASDSSATLMPLESTPEQLNKLDTPSSGETLKLAVNIDKIEQENHGALGTAARKGFTSGRNSEQPHFRIKKVVQRAVDRIIDTEKQQPQQLQQQLRELRPQQQPQPPWQQLKQEEPPCARLIVGSQNNADASNPAAPQPLLRGSATAKGHPTRACPNTSQQHVKDNREKESMLNVESYLQDFKEGDLEDLLSSISKRGSNTFVSRPGSRNVAGHRRPRPDSVRLDSQADQMLLEVGSSRGPSPGSSAVTDVAAGLEAGDGDCSGAYSLGSSAPGKLGHGGRSSHTSHLASDRSTALPSVFSLERNASSLSNASGWRAMLRSHEISPTLQRDAWNSSCLPGPAIFRACRSVDDSCAWRPATAEAAVPMPRSRCVARGTLPLVGEDNGSLGPTARGGASRGEHRTSGQDIITMRLAHVCSSLERQVASSRLHCRATGSRPSSVMAVHTEDRRAVPPWGRLRAL